MALFICCSPFYTLQMVLFVWRSSSPGNLFPMMANLLDLLKWKRFCQTNASHIAARNFRFSLSSPAFLYLLLNKTLSYFDFHASTKLNQLSWLSYFDFMARLSWRIKELIFNFLLLGTSFITRIGSDSYRRLVTVRTERFILSVHSMNFIRLGSSCRACMNVIQQVFIIPDSYFIRDLWVCRTFVGCHETPRIHIIIRFTVWPKIFIVPHEGGKPLYRLTVPFDYTSTKLYHDSFPALCRNGSILEPISALSSIPKRPFGCPGIHSLFFWREACSAGSNRFSAKTSSPSSSACSAASKIGHDCLLEHS